MKIIVESGATKSDWRVFEDGRQTARMVLPGMNVSSMKMSRIKEIIGTAFEAIGTGHVESLYFYTAGVLNDDIRAELTAYLTSIGVNGEIDIQTDLVAAARALFAYGEGIAAIMGTGSNTCLYDGRTVSQKVYSGGFILGDDGSASALARIFVSDFIKGRVPAEIAGDFEKEFDASYAAIVEGVYRSASPAKYLGSMAPFIVSRYDHPYVKGIVDANFQAFIDKSLKAYDTAALPVGIVGGFGYACRDIFTPLCRKAGITVSGYCPEPIESLIKLHIC